MVLQLQMQELSYWFRPSGKTVTRGIKSRVMSELQQSANDPSQTPADATGLFAPKPERGGTPIAVWAVAGLVVLLIVAGLIFAGRKKTSAPLNQILPLASYSPMLPLSQLAMSESTSLSGGKSTFIDGRIQNAGTQTVTAITVQVLFRNDEQMPPQVETLPLSFIRTHEPYIDTQSVSAAPLKPGDDREFRLIFETLPVNWNMQMPEIRIVQVDTR